MSTKLITKMIFSCIGNGLYLVSLLIPKSRQVWVFGSWGGRSYADNPRYFYEYVCAKHPEIKAVWLSQNKDVVAALVGKKKVAFRTNSILGFWYSCRAKVGVISHGMIDINRFACARMKIVQTWHGIPIKPVLLSDPKEDAICQRKRLVKLSMLFPYLRKELNYEKSLVICSSSEHVRELLTKVFGDGSPIENVGFPRLDPLFSPKLDGKLGRCIQEDKKKYERVGIYMPTYRREGEFDIVGYFKAEQANIESTLKEQKKIMYFKIHPFDYHKITDEFSSDYIRIIKNENIDGDIYEILGLFDFVITDYSSILFDYLVLSRPVYLMIPDRESYCKSNGNFVYEYNDLGLLTKDNWKDLLSSISTCDSISRRKLSELSKMIHQRRDNKNSERLYNLIVKKI